MEISLHLNPRLEKVFPALYKTRSLQSYSSLSTISCGAYKLTMKKGRSNFYEVLSLDSEKAGFVEIKKAYRRMVLQYHPDVCSPVGKEDSTRRFLELQEAYETLSDPISREIYDYELGLAGSEIRGVGGMRRRGRSGSSFQKEVWENQLRWLKIRSYNRMQRKKHGYVN